MRSTVLKSLIYPFFFSTGRITHTRSCVDLYMHFARRWRCATQKERWMNIIILIFPSHTQPAWLYAVIYMRAPKSNYTLLSALCVSVRIYINNIQSRGKTAEQYPTAPFFATTIHIHTINQICIKRSKAITPAWTAIPPLSRIILRPRVYIYGLFWHYSSPEADLEGSSRSLTNYRGMTSIFSHLSQCALPPMACHFSIPIAYFLSLSDSYSRREKERESDVCLPNFLANWLLLYTLYSEWI